MIETNGMILDEDDAEEMQSLCVNLEDINETAAGVQSNQVQEANGMAPRCYSLCLELKISVIFSLPNSLKIFATHMSALYVTAHMIM